MPLMPFLIMTEAQAADFREETSADENRLDPRLIDGGLYKGKYALPERVLYAPEFEGRRDALRMLTPVQFDTDVAWPPSEDI